jgi:hypothetical protein
MTKVDISGAGKGFEENRTFSGWGIFLTQNRPKDLIFRGFPGFLSSNRQNPGDFRVFLNFL